MEYPKVLDYYFSLVQVGFPEDEDDALRNPVYGGSAPAVRSAGEPRKMKARRDSTDPQHRKESRRSKAPPAAPMVGNFRR